MQGAAALQMDPGRDVHCAPAVGVRARGVVRPLDLVVACAVGLGSVIRCLIAVGRRRMVAFVAARSGPLIQCLGGSTPEVLSLMVLPSLEFSGLGCCQIQSRWRLVVQDEDRRKLWSASSARHRRRL